ncbi:hypothetical protein A8F94_18695 [Bacillus sp. FJAT-27225]|uniref:sigma-70 family RNA polymerase sigma factor n=1 Tax=Bacillus sp. FJAT-27225 TaxID=1743144 RepID=UPI00080C259B|nr:sigma-70 family RNA polymerase sigma factor [Bacillus sp. FJAT-27225]OCA83155.1 hypothetical protein A8F94_18695 [Bacillus sp. FJAT-27225]
MIPAKIEPVSITPIRKRDLEFIADWVEQHEKSFYLLGWPYAKSQTQMEELFYRSILNVHKQLPRFKNEISFETWVISIFLQTCREFSVEGNLQDSEENGPSQDLVKAIVHLNENERESIILTYIQGFSREEAAYVLNVSVEKVKEHLFSGIQSLKKELGYGGFNGCKEYHTNYIDYFEKKLDRPKKIDFEIHIYHCKNCQEDLAAFQDVMFLMTDFTDRLNDFVLPANFIENVKARLAEREKKRQLKNRKRLRIGAVVASVLALLLSIEGVTGAFSGLYYSYTEEDQQLRSFLQQDLGKMLNLEAESNGIKIRIKSVIADDSQTLIFYEIEDTAGDNQYLMNYHEGVFVENEYKIMNREKYPRYYPPDFESKLNKEKKNVYRGKMGLPPLTGENATIKLKVKQIMKLIRNPSSNYYDTIENKIGEWNFEVPATKKPSTEYALDKETEIDGIPVRFEKLTIAPTATILDYAIYYGSKKRIDFLEFDHLEVNDKKIKSSMHGGNMFNQEMDWLTFQMHFDSLYGEKAKDVGIQLKSAHLTVEDQKTIELDPSQTYPQTFEYAGSTISIDKFEVGKPTSIVISNHEIEGRAFETLQMDVVGEGINGSEMDSEGVLIDRNGKKYDTTDPINYEKIQPRYYFTVHRIKVHSNTGEEDGIPKSLTIFGYNSTRYLDEGIKISVE